MKTADKKVNEVLFMFGKPTVFIVDDDQSTRSALHAIIELTGLQAESYATAQDFLDSNNWDRAGCLVLDMRMPGMSGLKLQEELQKKSSLLPVIMITGHGDIPTALKALKQGAFEFLEKPVEKDTLLRSIQQAIAVNTKVRRREARLRELKERLARLKPQEQEVFGGIIEGRSNKVIAADIGVTTSTIEKRRRHVMQKMQAQTSADLIRMGLSCRHYLGYP